jgi:hypothetical protein
MNKKWFYDIGIIGIMSLGIPSFAYAQMEVLMETLKVFIIPLIITLVVLAVILLVFREVVCWYSKINQRITLLTEIRDYLSKMANQQLMPITSQSTKPKVKEETNVRSQSTEVSESDKKLCQHCGAWYPQAKPGDKCIKCGIPLGI